MAENDLTSADPWGLPVEERAEQPPERPEPTAAPTAEEPLPQEADEEPPFEAEDTTVESELEETPLAPDETSEQGAMEEGPLEAIPQAPEDAAVAYDDWLSGSQAERPPRNVLDSLDEGIEDLPDEPPEWIDEPDLVEASPPSVYQELTALTQPRAEDSAEADEAYDETTSEPYEEPTEAATTEEPADTEPPQATAHTYDETTSEPYEEPTEAATTEEPADTEPPQATAHTYDETTSEPGEEPTGEEPTPEGAFEPEDLEQAIAAIEPEGHEPTVEEPTGEEPTPEGAFEPEDLEQAIAAIEPEGYQSTGEPIDYTRDSLESALEEAVSAIGGPREDSDIFRASPGMSEVVGAPEDVVDEEEYPLVESPSVTWGSTWRDAAQGWIQQDSGRSTWRPIVTTTSNVGAWAIDTFLGIVGGDCLVDERDLEHARAAALRSMLDEALARGAHAVVGVHAQVHEIGGASHFNVIGTAVTLKSPS